MKRDLDLCRAILEAVEADPTGYAPSPLIMDGHGNEDVGYNALMLVEAGFVTGRESSSFGGTPTAVIGRMTWKGHEFLDAVRNEDIWSKTKSIAGKAGVASLEAVLGIAKDVGADAIKRVIGQHLGLP